MGERVVQVAAESTGRSLEIQDEGARQAQRIIESTEAQYRRVMANVVPHITQQPVNKQRAALQGLGLSSQALFGGISVGAAESYLAMSNFGLNVANATTATFGVLRGGIQEGFFNFLTGNFDNVGASFKNLGLRIVNVWSAVTSKANMVYKETLSTCREFLRPSNDPLELVMDRSLICSVH